MKRRKVINIKYQEEYVYPFTISIDGFSERYASSRETDVVFFAMGRKLDTFEVKHTNIIAKVRLR